MKLGTRSRGLVRFSLVVFGCWCCCTFVLYLWQILSVRPATNEPTSCVADEVGRRDLVKARARKR